MPRTNSKGVALEGNSDWIDKVNREEWHIEIGRVSSREEIHKCEMDL